MTCLGGAGKYPDDSPRPVNTGRVFLRAFPPLQAGFFKPIAYKTSILFRRLPRDVADAPPPPHPEERGNMSSRILGGLDRLLDRYVAVCLFLSLFILTWVGVGNAVTAGAAGLLLCAAGMGQPAERVDLKFLFPLALYNLASMASSYAAYGNIVDGYASTQMIFLAVYLLMAALSGEDLLLLRRLCVLWTGTAAAACVVQFVFRALVEDSPRRAGGVLGNPNAMGIFLVLGWFALARCGAREKGGRWEALAPCLEPLLLVALTLTLSMGSFLAMAAGILVLFIEKWRSASLKDALPYLCRLLAKASLAVGTGMLLYLAAARTSVPWVCLAVLAYALALATRWRRLDAFLEACPRWAAALTLVGVLTAAAAVAVRPSAAATFAERLAMMRNGLGYAGVDPLLGMGPYQWRLVNLADSDTYFNTWHIHNVLIHTAVELGWVAAAALVLAAVRFYRKKPDAAGKAAFTAFLLHNMIDTSFFYMPVVSLLMLTGARPQEGGQALRPGLVRAALGVLAALFAWNLYRCLQAA